MRNADRCKASEHFFYVLYSTRESTKNKRRFKGKGSRNLLVACLRYSIPGRAQTSCLLVLSTQAARTGCKVVRPFVSSAGVAEWVCLLCVSSPVLRRDIFPFLAFCANMQPFRYTARTDYYIRIFRIFRSFLASVIFYFLTPK